MLFLPKEHGAYGQLAFPLVTAFTVGGFSPAGLLIAVAATAGFVGHEPAAVLLGLRGIRARREHRREALGWLSTCGAIAIGTGIAALLAMPQDAVWSLSVPLVPAAVLAIAMMNGREKSWFSEVAAALAFSGAAMSVCLAGGTTLQTALTVAIPYALLFICGTLAVRVVILRVRGGGDPKATAITRRAVFAVAVGAAIMLAALTASDALPVGLAFAAAPGVLIAATVAAFPPPPARLRALGWTLVASSLITFVLIVAVAGG